MSWNLAWTCSSEFFSNFLSGQADTFHTNRKHKNYVLMAMKTKKGNARLVFSKFDDRISFAPEGEVVDAIPLGYEIYEHPNGNVFLRKSSECKITKDEIQLLEAALAWTKSAELPITDASKDLLSIYTPEGDVSRIRSLMEDSINRRTMEEIDLHLKGTMSYGSELRFRLVDGQNRTFVTERFCYRGSIDDWIRIGPPGKLCDLIDEYVPHLGEETFFELMY